MSSGSNWGVQAWNRCACCNHTSQVEPILTYASPVWFITGLKPRSLFRQKHFPTAPTTLTWSWNRTVCLSGARGKLFDDHMHPLQQVQRLAKEVVKYAKARLEYHAPPLQDGQHRPGRQPLQAGLAPDRDLPLLRQRQAHGRAPLHLLHRQGLLRPVNVQ